MENKLALGGAAIADYNYIEDGVGNITAIADAVMPGYSRTFGYDDLNRLTQANTGPLLWGTGSYTYDAMGNMIDRALGGSVVPSSPSDPDSGSVTPARATHFDYAGSRVSAVTENGLLRSVTYDAHGNETSYIATRTYMPRHNLLWKIEDDGEGVDHHVVTYQYDGRGVRVVRTETPVADPNGWAAQRTFVYSPELQLLSVTADDRPNLWRKRAVTNDVFIPRYDLVYFAGQPVAQIDGGTGAVRYTFTDHLGTPLLQTSATAAVIWQAEYEPFGNVWQMRTGSFSEQPLRFPGQDVATTWEGSEENYNIFRWYRSGWGRYTQADPIGIAADSNLFRYAASRPISSIDHLGLYCTTDFVLHYVGRSGTPVDLGAVGLLSLFTGSPSVHATILGERDAMGSWAAQAAKDACKGYNQGTKSGKFTTNDSAFVNIYSDETPCLAWPIGSTMLRVSSSCSYSADCGSKSFRYSCTSQWQLRDRFTNPMSQGEPGGNPGRPNNLLGVPYDITADWADRYSGRGSW